MNQHPSFFYRVGAGTIYKVNDGHVEWQYDGEQIDALRAELESEKQASISIAVICLNAGCKGEDDSTVSAVRQMSDKLVEKDAAIAELVEGIKKARTRQGDAVFLHHKNPKCGDGGTRICPNCTDELLDSLIAKYDKEKKA